MTVFDADRTAAHITQRVGETTVIREFGELPMICADTGEQITAPIRVSYNAHDGLVFDIGPYSIDHAYAAELRTALDTYLADVAWDTGS